MLLTACSYDLPPQPQLDSLVIKTTQLVDQDTSPEMKNEIWLNTDYPLFLSELHGQVVLLEMWTFG